MKQRNPWTWLPSLYFSEGLPYVAVTILAMILYKQLGLSHAEITFYTGWLYLPWLIKPLWKLLIDGVKNKRWWIVTMELLIGASFAGVAFTIPTASWLQGTLFFFWLMAFSVVTHDIASADFYKLALDDQGQSWLVGIRSIFYRIAMIFGQGFLVMIAGNLQIIHRNSISLSWSLTFYAVAGIFIALWLWHHYVLPRPHHDVVGHGRIGKHWGEFRKACVDFFTGKDRREMIVALLFILFYRMPEGLLSKVSTLFLIDASHRGGLGLSPQEYGLVQGTVGIIGLSIGGILGGLAVGKDGLRRWLWVMALAVTLPDLVYVYLSYALPSNLMLISLCVFVQQLGYGFGFIAYMLYLMYYCKGEYKTEHYALCTSLTTLSMMIPALFAGALQTVVGYRWFFIIVMLCCVLTFLVTALLKVDPLFGKNKDEEEWEEEMTEA